MSEKIGLTRQNGAYDASNTLGSLLIIGHSSRRIGHLVRKGVRRQGADPSFGAYLIS